MFASVASVPVVRAWTRGTDAWGTRAEHGGTWVWFRVGSRDVFAYQLRPTHQRALPVMPGSWRADGMDVG
jgi:hypothetical protein